ncbi:hypothetical protein [Flammeovirga sp. OC4]|uniref:hypothetical protein n=1 Tax=Flammeovirga sp. OC4 TaxID=1382345 RepID=UPI0012E04C29|nr:hypothetical protein [Flammeovirga sp. OC4]
MKQLYHYIQALSIDVALGAIVCSMFLGKINNTEIPTPIYFSLGIAVWVIYTLDHLMDAFSIQHTAHTFRHAFHQKYKKALSTACSILAFVGFIITVTYLPLTVFYHGIILMIIVGAYLLIINLKFVPFSTFKETTVALIYTLGVALPVYSLSDTYHPALHFFSVSIFILATINLLEFSLFDFESDKKDKMMSGALKLGYDGINIRLKILFALFLLLFLISFIWLRLDYIIPQIIFFLMGLSLFIIYIKSDFFSKDDYFRILGDFVFLYPVLWVL